MARSPGSKVSFDEFLVFLHQAGVETSFQAEMREVLEVFKKFAKKEVRASMDKTWQRGYCIIEFLALTSSP